MRIQMYKFISSVFVIYFCMVSCSYAISYSAAQENCRQTMKNNPPIIDITYNYGELRYNINMNSEELEKIHDKNRPLQGNYPARAGCNRIEQNCH